LTALAIATQLGNATIVEILLRSNAAMETVVSHVHTPLSLAARNGHTEVVDKLLAAGANVEGAAYTVRDFSISG